MAAMLATLDFNFAKDADGNDITFGATFETGQLSVFSLLLSTFGS